MVIYICKRKGKVSYRRVSTLPQETISSRRSVKTCLKNTEERSVSRSATIHKKSQEGLFLCPLLKPTMSGINRAI